MKPGGEQDAFRVLGRGLLHLGVLIETMRREGYELAVGKPRVVIKTINGVAHEPFESLVVEVPPTHMGAAMEVVGNRRGELVHMGNHAELTRLEFTIPSRGLIGMRNRMLTATSGEAIMYHRFDCFRPLAADVPGRGNGVLVSTASGRAAGFALLGLQERSVLFIEPGAEVYEGMIVGENSRENDMPVNPCREKKLTNIRSSTAERTIPLKAPRKLTLEGALEYLDDDELVEVTPSTVRLRKIHLTEQERRRAARVGA
jgi:GTP-binding protein